MRPYRHKNPWRLVFLLFLLCASSYAAWAYADPSVIQNAPIVGPLLAPMGAKADAVPGGWKVFSSNALGISLDYPATFSVSIGSVRTPLSSHAVPTAIFFAIPGSYAPGTTLSSEDSGFAVELLPDVAPCTADAFLDESLSTGTLTDRGVGYSVAKSVGTTLSDSYQETAYAISGSDPCVAVSYVVHTKDPHAAGNAGLTPFDESTLIRQFDNMRRSLTITR